MEKEFKKAEEALRRLHDLYNNHMESFGQEALPDLEKQSEDRGIEVGRLMESTSKLIKLIEKQTGEKADTESMILSLNDGVASLLEQNKGLETKVSAFRSKLKDDMNHLSKGKNAISSYRSSAAVSNDPRVISITNY